MNESEIKAEINRLQNLLKEKESVNYELTRANYRQKYFYISKFTNGIGVDSTEDYQDNSMDNFNYKQFNYFIDEEKANRFAEHIRLTFKLFQIRDVVRDCWEPDWDNDRMLKYYVEVRFNELFKDHTLALSRCFSFQTSEKRDKFIEIVGEENLLKYLSF